MALDAGRPSTVELIPVLINSAGDPELAEGEDAARILATLTDLSAPLGTRVTVDGTRGRVILPAVGSPLAGGPR